MTTHQPATLAGHFNKLFQSGLTPDEEQLREAVAAIEAEEGLSDEVRVLLAADTAVRVDGFFDDPDAYIELCRNVRDPRLPSLEALSNALFEEADDEDNPTDDDGGDDEDDEEDDEEDEGDDDFLTLEGTSADAVASSSGKDEASTWSSADLSSVETADEDEDQPTGTSSSTAPPQQARPKPPRTAAPPAKRQAAQHPHANDPVYAEMKDMYLGMFLGNGGTLESRILGHLHNVSASSRNAVALLKTMAGAIRRREHVSDPDDFQTIFNVTLPTP